MPAKYIRLANQLKELLLQNTGNGIYKLPSEHALCQQYHVSRQTVRAALRLLSEEGLVEKRQGSGSFSTGHSIAENNIGVILNNADEYTSPALLGDIRAVLRDKGYQIQVYSTCGKIAEERRILQLLKSMPLRGLIAEGTRTSLPTPNLDLYEKLQSRGISLLFLGGYAPNLPESACIKEDNYYGGYLLTKHLIQKGHNRIAGIFKSDDIQGPERYYGFLSALRDFHIPFTDEQSLWYTSSHLTSLEKKSDTGFLTSFLRKNRHLYTAVVCHNDEIAYWLIRELGYARIRVPEDISIVSFDNSYMSDRGPVRITTLSHGEPHMGTVAARTILKMIRGETVSTEALSWRLISKGSDTPPSKNSLLVFGP